MNYTTQPGSNTLGEPKQWKLLTTECRAERIPVRLAKGLDLESASEVPARLQDVWLRHWHCSQAGGAQAFGRRQLMQSQCHDNWGFCHQDCIGQGHHLELLVGVLNTIKDGKWCQLENCYRGHSCATTEKNGINSIAIWNGFFDQIKHNHWQTISIFITFTLANNINIYHYQHRWFNISVHGKRHF